MPTTYDSATVELAMTLSTLAYVDENRTATQQQMINEINAGLEEPGYKAWQVVWGPALNVDRSNLAYVDLGALVHSKYLYPSVRYIALIVVARVHGRTTKRSTRCFQR